MNTQNAGTLGATNPQQKRVTMYTTSWCSDCRAAKRYLANKGITWNEVDIEQDEAAAEQVVKWSGGYRTVPTFDIEGTIIVDFNARSRPQLDAALGL